MIVKISALSLFVTLTSFSLPSNKQQMQHQPRQQDPENVNKTQNFTVVNLKDSLVNTIFTELPSPRIPYTILTHTIYTKNIVPTRNQTQDFPHALNCASCKQRLVKNI